MEMTKELLEKAKSAKSAEELLTMAKENGMADFTEENAKAYFEQLHKSGEISDEALEKIDGGVQPKPKIICEYCGSPTEEHSKGCPRYSGRTRL